MTDILNTPPGADKFKFREGNKDQISDPVELHTENDLADFWLTYKRNNKLLFGTEKREKAGAVMQARASLAQLETEPNNIHFFGARNEDQKMVATGKLEIRLDKAGVKYGYLSLLTVDPEYRGQRVAKKMTDLRTDYARDAGCHYLGSDVFVANPVGLAAKFNDDFVLVGLDVRAAKFHFYKKIDNEQAHHDNVDGMSSDIQEVVLSDHAEIVRLLHNGYVGVDARNTGGEEDNDPKKWILILENKN